VQKTAKSNGHWVFGYGSLMWLPGFEFEAQHPARVYGWHRNFSLISTASWGSKNSPGLVVALHPGGSCLGMAFRISARQWPETLAYLKHRERAYRFVDVSARLLGGDTADDEVKAVSFAFDPEHPRTVGAMDWAEKARLIQRGVGSVGSSQQYFDGIHEHLNALGQTRNPLLDRLAKHFEER
jgi:cation transport protein ChaC